MEYIVLPLGQKYDEIMVMSNIAGPEHVCYFKQIVMSQVSFRVYSQDLEFLQASKTCCRRIRHIVMDIHESGKGAFLPRKVSN